MLAHYLKATALDLNAHYPAINALGLLKLQSNLARALPQLWTDAWDGEECAVTELKAIDQRAARLCGTLALSLDCDPMLSVSTATPDPWMLQSKAEYLLLTASDRPKQSLSLYQAALSVADQFHIDASRRNLDIYRLLGQFEPAASTILDMFDSAAHEADPRPPQHAILFTGHMIDQAGFAAAPRFPRSAQAEARARAMIRAAVEQQVDGHPEHAIGIAGGACGGDMLFHEVCLELGVRSAMFLAVPRERFEVESVQRGGSHWVARYRTLCSALPVHVLQQDTALPPWLGQQADYDVWQRANRWMMYHAMASGAHDLVVIALLNRQLSSKGQGGASHLCDVAASCGFMPIELDASVLPRNEAGTRELTG